MLQFEPTNKTQKIKRKMLRALDEITTQAKSLGEFLSNSKLVDSYFTASQKYFGEFRFPRKDFDELVAQLRELDRLFPWLSARLWEKTSEFSSFEIELERAHSRDLNAEEWEQYLKEWKAKLQDEFTGYEFHHENFNEFITQSISVLNKLGEEITRFQNEADSSIKKKNDFYATLCERPELNYIASRSLFIALGDDFNRPILQCEDSEQILILIRDWRNAPNLLFHYQIRSLTSPIQSLVRDRIPTLPDLLQLEKIFPKRGVANKQSRLRCSKSIRAGVYKLDVVPRRFHSIWRGIAVNDCLVKSDMDHCPIANRWLAAIAQGSHTIHIQSEKKFFGSIHLQTIVSKEAKWLYVEFWADMLAIFVQEKSAKKRKSLPFSLLILEKLQEMLPLGFSGICLSSNSLFDNFGVCKVLRQSILGKASRSIGSAKCFHLNDPQLELAAAKLPYQLPSFMASQFSERVSLVHALYLDHNFLIEPLLFSSRKIQ